MTKHKDTKKMGRPSKKEDLDFTIAYNLAKTGHCMVEIANAMGVDESTIYRWMERDENFRKSIKDGKKLAIQRMTDSLYHRGIGYTHPEEKLFQYEGKVVRADTLKHYPPDTAAAFIWLKNVDSKNWRDKHEVEFSGFKHDIFKDSKDNDLEQEAVALAKAINDRRKASAFN